MSKFLTSILFATVLLVSCNKSKDTNEIPAEGKLIGKWTFESTLYYNGVEWKTVPAAPGSYLDFESGGKLTAKISNAISYSTWDLLDEGKTLFIMNNGILDVPKNGYQIKKITDSNLELYANEAGAPAEKGITLNFHK